MKKGKQMEAVLAALQAQAEAVLKRYAQAKERKR